MRKLILSAAAVTILAGMMVPASAELNYGPTKKGDQCWKDYPTRKGEFGYWAACPAPASVAAAPAAKKTKKASR